MKQKINSNAVHDVWRAKRAAHAAKKQLPADWLPSIHSEAKDAAWFEAMHPSGVIKMYRRNAAIAAKEVYQKWTNEYGGAAAADLSDADIKRLAAEYAIEAETLDIGRVTVGQVNGSWGELVRLLDFCEHREVEPPKVFLLASMGARVRCKYWWRRALRRMVARRSERGAMSLGLVSKQAGQSYASNKAVFRRIDQNKRNREAMENTALENEDGQRATLAELAARSVSNKAVRRGELMTRIRGCEEIADELGYVGVFLTLTCPSRFHSTKHTGKRNKKHDGSTPKDAQKWLCGMWARARAKLQRRGLAVFGFRVAEPHHDGCPHWHALLWARDSEAIDGSLEIIKDYWLSDDGDERGADKYRVNSKRMERGGAAGYIAKYIAKNIDDVGIDSHIDDYADSPIGTDLLGDVEVKPSMRVEAWASTWGIRQFQPIGQPPVGVWRELRRVAESKARDAGLGGWIHDAWRAANGNWAGYVKAQGGMMVGRNCRIVVANEVREIKGRYETQDRKCVIGVRINNKGSSCVYSERRLWRVVERGQGAGDFAGAKPTPRTRVNNCTHNRLRSHAVVYAMAHHRESGALHTEPIDDYTRILVAIRRSKQQGVTNSS
jgi:Bacteriophage replication gene A protein (GPA)